MYVCVVCGVCVFGVCVCVYVCECCSANNSALNVSEEVLTLLRKLKFAKISFGEFHENPTNGLVAVTR